MVPDAGRRTEVPSSNEHKTLCILENVEKRFGRNASPVLGPLSLKIYSSEILGIRGLNGAGKSTLISVIAGVYSPDAGRIRYAEGVRGQTGYVPQELSLYETLTVNENLKFYGIAAGLQLKAIKIRQRWLLKRLGLEDKARVKVSECSGGMKRRIHLASALMVTPPMLLLDEPTVGADTNSAETILELLLHLKSIGCGIVLVTHADEELNAVCDRIITLKDGVITEEA